MTHCVVVAVDCSASLVISSVRPMVEDAAHESRSVEGDVDIETAVRCVRYIIRRMR